MVPLMVIASLAFLACLSIALIACLKIKSSKKDPAFVGVEGTISPLKDANGTKRSNLAVSSSPPLTPSGSPSAQAHDNLDAPDRSGGLNVSASSNRTPSRSGERKLPDIPKDDRNSDLYATLDGSDSEDDDEEPSVSAAAASGPLIKKHNHPYAKVKKSKVEHPYATVKKVAVADTTPAELASSSSDGDDSGQLLLRPSGVSREGRTGSGRSSHHFEAAGSSQSVNSRQATPLPPEPPAQPVPPANAVNANNMQNPNMHFSGDSQDSSKGYTSITVREPVRHIQLARSGTVDATYATVSETSDEMYAAIEEPSYVPTGNASQSNSDTYAVIDLPEEDDVDMTPGGAQASTSSLPPASAPPIVPPSSTYHAYSTIDKSKKMRAGPQAPMPSSSNNHRHHNHHNPLRRLSRNVEDMYAKVHKRTSAADDLDNLPVGASAMHSMEMGARPKIRAAPAPQPDWGSIIGDAGSRSKTEINYSDFEVSLYDKGKHKPKVPPLAQKDSEEEGYETLPPLKDETESGYEVLPESEWKKKRFSNNNNTKPSSNGGYETVPAPDGFDKEPGYEHVPDYWRSNNSGGYETVREREPSSRDPGYEVVKERFPRLNDYDSIDRKRLPSESKDPGYESVDQKKVYQAQILDNESDTEMGYETISRVEKEKQLSDYDPGYEMLTTKGQRPAVTSEPGYETVETKRRSPALPEYETLKQATTEATAAAASSPASSSSASQQPSLIHMSVVSKDSSSPDTPGYQRRSSVVVIEHVEVSDVDRDGSSSPANPAEVNTHIFV